jgi:hypothetical protein
MTTLFCAFYEDASKAEAEAKAAGFTGSDGESWHDFIEVQDDKCRTGKTFDSLAGAEMWLKEEIAATKTVYGCGEILEQEPITRRCRYCVCGGRVKNVRRYVVDHEGIAEDEAVDDLCHG